MLVAYYSGHETDKPQDPDEHLAGGCPAEEVTGLAVSQTFQSVRFSPGAPETVARAESYPRLINPVRTAREDSSDVEGSPDVLGAIARFLRKSRKKDLFSAVEKLKLEG